VMKLLSTKWMKMMKVATAVTITAVAIFSLVACSGPIKYEKKDHRSGVYYEIFVRAFHDSDGDGIGDFNGITQKLDYLNDGDPNTDTDLGVEGIWLMPIHPSPSYHGYDVTDFYDVNPSFGTMADFENLIKEAHKRGIKIIIDLIVNHTSSKHLWFINSAYAPEGPYRDWYVWADKDDDIGEQSALGSVGWHFANDRYYQGTFWDQMPDLNFDHPPVQKEIGKVGQFWLKKGVDGFRLDAAKHIFVDKQSDINNPEIAKKNQNMWQLFRKDLNQINPKAILVGEVWDVSNTIAMFLDQALDSAFNFELQGLILSAVKDGSRSEIARYLKGVYEEYDAEAKGQYIDSTFIGNHDKARVMTTLFEDREKAKMAATFQLTLPGVPYIYYGEELGMTGNKPDEEIRLPFPWYKSGSGTGQTNWYQDETIYDSTNFEHAYDVQINDESSIYNHYRTLIHLRNQYGALTEGSILEYPSDNLEVELYIRKLGEQQLLVAHNVSGKSQKIKLVENNEIPMFDDVVYETREGTDFSDDTMTIPAHTSVILQP
jgi:alpha-amylase